MTLESLVPSLDLCQQLKFAGFPQDTAFKWCRLTGTEKYSINTDAENYYVPAEEVCAAPTAEEILKELPPYLQGSCCQLDLDVMHFSGCNVDGTPALLKWIVQWCCPEIDEVAGAQESESTLVLAAAQAYLWWKREGVTHECRQDYRQHLQGQSIAE